MQAFTIRTLNFARHMVTITEILMIYLIYLQIKVATFGYTQSCNNTYQCQDYLLCMDSGLPTNMSGVLVCR